MNHLKYRERQKPYEEALLEVDREKFKQKLLQAEAAIFLRLQQLATAWTVTPSGKPSMTRFPA